MALSQESHPSAKAQVVARRDLRRDLLRGGVGSLGVKAGYLGLQLATSVILARTLGPRGYGTYTFVVILVGVVAIPAQFGFPGLMVRRLAILKSQGKLSLLKGVLSRSARLVSLVSVTLAAGLWLALTYFGSPFAEIPAGPLRLGLLLLPILALVQLGSGSLLGLGHVVVGQISLETVRPVALLLCVVLISLIDRLDAERAILANLAATCLALIFAAYIVVRVTPTGTPMQAQMRTRTLVAEAIPFLFLAGIQVINQQTDTLMLGIMARREDVGLYRVAVQLSDGVGMVLMALGAVIAPHLARLSADGDGAALRRILVGGHRLGIGVVLPLTVLLSVFAIPLLDFVFGSEYTSASDALIILLVGKVGYAAVGFSGVALSMFGMAWTASFLTGVGVLSNVILNLLLIPGFGISGAAVANVCSAVGMSVLGILWMGMRLGSDFSALGLRLPAPRMK